MQPDAGSGITGLSKQGGQFVDWGCTLVWAILLSI